MGQAIGIIRFVTDGGHENRRVGQARTGGLDYASRAGDSFSGSCTALNNFR